MLLAIKIHSAVGQGEDPDYAWTVTVISFWLKLAMGLVCFVLSLAWMLQVQLCIHPPPPPPPRRLQTPACHRLI